MEAAGTGKQVVFRSSSITSTHTGSVSLSSAKLSYVKIVKLMSTGGRSDGNTTASRAANMDGAEVKRAAI